ncbi:MAG: lipoyl(octanoyl) transferase LipB [Burkholderiaceae bacterium]|nr:lipoyl(octanoyl) transferase LipB [Burkholderiaceae bacterium]
MSMIYRNLGLVDFLDTYRNMRYFTQTRTEETADEIWFCEHYPVYSLGLSTKKENLLTVKNYPVVSTDRGGDVTYHAPGQLVAYPLISLRRYQFYPKDYILWLQQSVIQLLSYYGINGLTLPNIPGVFIKKKGGEGTFKDLSKIASFGIKISKGYTYHGLSINVSLNLSGFSKINPCGYKGLRNTSLKECGIQVSTSTLSQQLKNIFEERFVE